MITAARSLTSGPLELPDHGDLVWLWRVSKSMQSLKDHIPSVYGHGGSECLKMRWNPEIHSQTSLIHGFVSHNQLCCERILFYWYEGSSHGNGEVHWGAQDWPHLRWCARPLRGQFGSLTTIKSDKQAPVCLFFLHLCIYCLLPSRPTRTRDFIR